MSMFRAAVLVLALAVPVAGVAFAAENADLEQVLIESADTPAEHQALANHFHKRAEAARRKAAEHRAMAMTYAGGRAAPFAQAQSAHCNRLAKTAEAQAAEYDALAEAHAEEAKK